MKLTSLFTTEAPMQRLVRISAFGAILWHMLAGCCMHHAHANPVSDGDSQVIERAHACDCHHHEQSHGEHDAPCDPWDHHDHGQCSQECSFVVPDPRNSVELKLTISPLGGITLAEFAGCYASPAFGQNICLGYSPLRPPDRSSAVLQVFLL